MTRPAPAAEPAYVPSGWARWIGRSWLGHRTASGEMFDADRLTGAHASLPLPSFLYVTNKRNGRTILIRINDRVPAARDRVIIVSRRAAELLDFRAAGRVEVDIQYGGRASPVPNEKHERAFLMKQPWYRGRSAAVRRMPRASVRQRTAERRYAIPTYPRWDNTRR
ncbi:MAG: septal ring lytic transglycosylase RlpA family protein [Hyphomicrobiaceae bacterium]